MTGSEHYREAERLLLETLPGADLPDEVVARAQVHATLAIADLMDTWGREIDDRLRSLRP